MSEDEVAGWRHRCNGHELVQTLGDGEGQGGLGVLQPVGSQSQTQLGGTTTVNTMGQRKHILVPHMQPLLHTCRTWGVEEEIKQK